MSQRALKFAAAPGATPVACASLLPVTTDPGLISEASYVHPPAFLCHTDAPLRCVDTAGPKNQEGARRCGRCGGSPLESSAHAQPLLPGTPGGGQPPPPRSRRHGKLEQAAVAKGVTQEAAVTLAVKKELLSKGSPLLDAQNYMVLNKDSHKSTSFERGWKY